VGFNEWQGTCRKERGKKAKQGRWARSCTPVHAETAANLWRKIGNGRSALGDRAPLASQGSDGVSQRKPSIGWRHERQTLASSASPISDGAQNLGRARILRWLHTRAPSVSAKPRASWSSSAIHGWILACCILRCRFQECVQHLCGQQPSSAPRSRMAPSRTP
jgi:hypothetical protein